MRDTAIQDTPSWGREVRATLMFAWPLALANLLQSAIYIIDVIFIARLGEEPLAASGLAAGLFGLIVWSLASLTGAVAPRHCRGNWFAVAIVQASTPSNPNGYVACCICGVCGHGSSFVAGTGDAGDGSGTCDHRTRQPV